jgi:sporulation protein YlmC with PRC-barrel domain
MAANVPAFRASDFIGKSVHALDGATLPAAEAMTDPTLRWTGTDRFTAERNRWDDIGNVEDVVMTQDGSIRGILVDVGGFLGIGARTVMVEIENLYFVAEDSTPEDLTDFDVVATYSRAQLEALPEFEESALEAGFPAIDWSLDMDAVTADRAEVSGPNAEPEAAFTKVAASDLTAEQMLGATVEDAEGNSAGSVEDLVLDANETVSEVIVDVGGLLGIGAHRVALPVDGANILWNPETNELRIQTTMTQDQLETLPEYQG